jgi:hypothetical protein
MIEKMGKTHGDIDEVNSFYHGYDLNELQPYEMAMARPGSGKDPEEYDQLQLRRGTSEEMEHTTDKQIAMKIAMDHLDEDPAYYVKLARYMR